MRLLVILLFVCMLSSCGDPSGDSPVNTTGTLENTGTVINDSVRLRDSLSRLYENDLSIYSNLGGVVGIYNVKPMLSLCKKDSSPVDKLGMRIAEDFRLLDREAARLGVNGTLAGQISYNNNPENFKFECLLLIDSIPTMRSDSVQAVMLEPANMLVYNHYGAYASLHEAYDKIRKYCKASKLIVAGPMREFYVSDPAEQHDSSKWLTRIFVPVAAKESEK
jgi:hypothetical protein